jgi:predicted peptidase
MGGSGGSGGAGGSGGGGGSGGAGGGSAGVPWEGHIDPNGGPPSGRLVPHQLGSTTAPQGFYDYVPAGYPDGAKWPLLVALHGIGENGNGTSDLPKILATGIHALLKNDKWPNDRPFVVVMPQHPGGGCPSATEVQKFIAWSIDNYEIDPSYVYLTGLSCGAIGSWSYLAENLDSQIAAFVPVAGDGKPAWSAKGCELGKVPIWGFHGDADDVVNVSGTNVPLDGLAGCPKPPALESKKTIYPGVKHNSWDMTYSGMAGHDIYTWMLGFKKAN